jgi:anti-anti-sigma factor
MKIDTRKAGDVVVVEMSGRLDSRSSGEAGDRIVHIVQGDDRQILLNLQNVDYVSSAGLRIILLGSKLLQGNQGELKICCVEEAVKRVLETSGFDSLIRMYNTEAEAHSAFAKIQTPAIAPVRETDRAKNVAGRIER